TGPWSTRCDRRGNPGARSLPIRSSTSQVCAMSVPWPHPRGPRPSCVATSRAVAPGPRRAPYPFESGATHDLGQFGSSGQTTLALLVRPAFERGFVLLRDCGILGTCPRRRVLLVGGGHVVGSSVTL